MLTTTATCTDFCKNDLGSAREKCLKIQKRSNNERNTKNVCGGGTEKKKPKACHELTFVRSDDGRGESSKIKGLSLRYLSQRSPANFDLFQCCGCCWILESFWNQWMVADWNLWISISHFWNIKGRKLQPITNRILLNDLQKSFCNIACAKN